MTMGDQFPIKGRVSAWDGDTLIAESEAAVATDTVEANGGILIPAADGSLTSHDPEALRIEVEDRWPNGGGTTNRFPRWGDVDDLLRLIDVQPAGDGAFTGPTYGDIRRNVVEGGQLLAMSMVAAAKSAPDKRVVNAHIVLERPAVFDKPIDLTVDRQRVGRQFATLGVRATQGGKPVSCSLILLDHGSPDLITGQIAMPEVKGPEDCPAHDFGLLGRDVRFVNGDYDPDPDRIGPPELHCWIRHRDAPKELYLQQALLAQPVTHFTIAAAMLPHPGFGEAQAHYTLSTGVLTATIALHGEPDLTDWLLYTNPAIHAGRGLAQGQGHVFTRDGRLVASYTVQAMIREFAASANESGLDSTRIM
ncbi:acyl-CoA thioesterase [Sphingomonas montanisoli]|uniref:Acyl-CoA thioesterase n=2 Tax=Sphingomonas montanisoli TaxID=2606412 RepID=A0A5D9C505_9SPHN|nr:acyl-CoA thioesterase [Sphingomonas montanisoli]